MQVAWGQHLADLDIPTDRLVPLRQSPRPEPIVDLAAAVDKALEEPFEFPPLRRALTPEDKVTIVVEPNVPHTGLILARTLGHLAQASIDPAAVTIVCLSADQDQSWIDELPDEYLDVHVETHHPGERKELSYLATTKGGRRIYLNRSLVDADQSVVITRRRYDTRLGYAGGPGVLFPGLCETETADALRPLIIQTAPNTGPWKLRHEAEEVAFLLGAPFFVQVIEGHGDEILHVVGGSLDSCRHAQTLFDNAWHVAVDEPADLVIAGVSGKTFADLAHAALSASRVVRPGGRIVLLSDADPELGPAAEILRQEEDANHAKQRILDEKPADMEAGVLWASAVLHAKMYLLSRLPIETAEELSTTPLDRPEQTQRLIAAAASVIVLPDADRTLATVQCTPHAPRED